MNSPAYDIANMIDASPIGLGELAVDLFVSREPTTPNNCISIFDTGGFEPDAKHDISRPTIQIRVRNSVYLTGYNLATAIKDALHGLYEQEEGLSNYLIILAMGDVTHIGLDDSNRNIFTINFRMIREPK
jgi:hypothetical protein